MRRAAQILVIGTINTQEQSSAGERTLGGQTGSAPRANAARGKGKRSKEVSLHPIEARALDEECPSIMVGAGCEAVPWEDVHFDVA